MRKVVTNIIIVIAFLFFGLRVIGQFKVPSTFTSGMPLANSSQ